MFCDVVERLLNDPVNGHFDLRGDAGGFVLSRLEIHVDAVARRPSFRQIANGLDKPEVIERSGTQFQCYAVKITRGLPGQFLEGLYPAAEFVRASVRI